jgi:hypothetical protein
MLTFQYTTRDTFTLLEMFHRLSNIVKTVSPVYASRKICLLK